MAFPIAMVLFALIVLVVGIHLMLNIAWDRKAVRAGSIEIARIADIRVQRSGSENGVPGTATYLAILEGEAYAKSRIIVGPANSPGDRVEVYKNHLGIYCSYKPMDEKANFRMAKWMIIGGFLFALLGVIAFVALARA